MSKSSYIALISLLDVNKVLFLSKAFSSLDQSKSTFLSRFFSFHRYVCQWKLENTTKWGKKVYTQPLAHRQVIILCLHCFLLGRSKWATASVSCDAWYHPSGATGSGGAWCPAGPQAGHRKIHPHQPQHCKPDRTHAKEVRTSGWECLLEQSVNGAVRMI